METHNCSKNNLLERLRQEVLPYANARRWFVGFSGGVDSSALLHALVSLVAHEKQQSHQVTFPEIISVHINHQIQTNAELWEIHCQNQSSLLGVKCFSFKVVIDATHNIEEQAREARYGIFTNVMEEGDCMFLAHHQLDQVETLFYRLFRGSGVKGLSAINKERLLGKGFLVRPLLDIEKSAIEMYAQEKQLSYIEDPSNKDTKYDRNFIRQKLVPLIQERWAFVVPAMQRSVKHLQEANALLDQLAESDFTLLQSNEIDEPWIGLQGLDNFSLPRKNNVLRYWLHKHGLRLSEMQLLELINNVINAKDDAQPEFLLGTICLRRYQNKLYIGEKKIAAIGPFIEWNGLKTCDIPYYGKLILSIPVDVNMQVRWRIGGEKIKPIGSDVTRKLKTLFQELEIEVWRRPHLPLIYAGDELIAVGDIILSQNAERFIGKAKILKK